MFKFQIDSKRTNRQDEFINRKFSKLAKKASNASYSVLEHTEVFLAGFYRFSVSFKEGIFKGQKNRK